MSGDVESILEDLAVDDDLTLNAATKGMVRFVLQKMVDSPEDVAVRDVADVLAALAKSGVAEGAADVDEVLRRLNKGTDE